MDYYASSKPLITQFREGHQLMRFTALMILCCFAVVFYSPAVNATINAVEDYLAYKPEYTVFADMEAALADTQQLVQQLQSVNRSLQGPSIPTLSAEMHQQRLQQQLKEQQQVFFKLDKQATGYFEDQLERYQRQQQSPSVIKGLKHQQQQYRDNNIWLLSRLERLSIGKGPKLTEELSQTIALLDKLYQPVQHPYDQIMPFGPSSITSGVPVKNAADLEAILGPNTLTNAIENEDRPTFTTVETTITPAIEALANSLGNDYVAIYNWVRNNIEFIPSYGSLQGADYTLQSRRGNAMDQASLLIALLKATGASARYEYGSIRLTNEEAMNWAGGVRAPAAAQNLFAQGGVPVARLSVNGNNDYMLVDHVWVRLYIGSGQWAYLDPSYKQYDYSEGMDLQSEVAFDAEAFANTLESTATVNETEGWVQNVNQAFIETELDDYRQALEDYLTNQQADATVGDVIGNKTIVPRTANVFPTSSSYYQIQQSQQFSQVPDNLQYKFMFQLQDTFGGELLSHTATTVELAGKSLAVSFNPATTADEQALLDYLPDDPQSVEDLPNTIPAGLMNVVGELTINGTAAATSAAMSFGQVLQTEKGYFFPGKGWSTTTNPIITGEYQAIGLDYHGLAPQQLEALQTKLENTKTQLEAENFTGLTKHEVVGDLMQSAVMSYMAITDVQSKLAARSGDVVYYREPSYGTFQTNAKPNGLLGTVSNIEMIGLLMDMDSMKFNTECKDNCLGKWRDYNQHMGATYSAYEHLIPEQLFSTEEEPVEGISAVKALAIASQQGQRIYTFTEDNLSYLSDLTVDQGTKDEILAQVQAGMVATVHQHPITYAGWTGTGYTIVHPETGAGSYKISGGSNGGNIVNLESVPQPLEWLLTGLGLVNKTAGVLSLLVAAYNYLLNCWFTVVSDGALENSVLFLGMALFPLSQVGIGLLAGFWIPILLSIALTALALVFYSSLDGACKRRTN
ncbi:transglutaminase-like domain-containing protein [Oceanicoccus sagamiensis]|uniref:Transglutaminase-like domain-containing protein n=1 Tax=Oceanicoccus sagamiensis TaxID=716816 RepID=A0A1X9NHE7_9GAMM|nr:transglutaminase-like domain-containing protein [Oceanicoccus sagamiensis]ARN74337.1 hypothetical protein BST96_09495 [Oceanicoccus sagamiensis]